MPARSRFPPSAPRRESSQSGARESTSTVSLWRQNWAPSDTWGGFSGGGPSEGTTTPVRLRAEPEPAARFAWPQQVGPGADERRIFRGEREEGGSAGQEEYLGQENYACVRQALREWLWKVRDAWGVFSSLLTRAPQSTHPWWSSLGSRGEERKGGGGERAPSPSYHLVLTWAPQGQEAPAFEGPLGCAGRQGRRWRKESSQSWATFWKRVESGEVQSPGLPFARPASDGRLGGHLAGDARLATQTWEKTLARRVIRRVGLAPGASTPGCASPAGILALEWGRLHTCFPVVLPRG